MRLGAEIKRAPRPSLASRVFAYEINSGAFNDFGERVDDPARVAFAGLSPLGRQLRNPGHPDQLFPVDAGKGAGSLHLRGGDQARSPSSNVPYFTLAMYLTLHSKYQLGQITAPRMRPNALIARPFLPAPHPSSYRDLQWPPSSPNWRWTINAP